MMRADLFLVQGGHAPSRQQAKRLIEDGCVTLDGKKLSKASEPVADGEHTVTVENNLRYVGRGGWKLEGALQSFGLSVTGKTCMDVGASTGGFTDCLLQSGAKKVFAVDSGEGQLAQKLLTDDRVISMEHTNARFLTVERIGEAVDLIAMDVSFISAAYLIPLFCQWLKPDGDAIVLVKPQFEVGKQGLGKGGIVKDPSLHLQAVKKVKECGESNGLFPLGLIPSPVTGGDGNREFLLWFSRSEKEKFPIDDESIRSIVFDRKGGTKSC